MNEWAILWTTLLMPIGVLVLVSLTIPFTLVLRRYLPDGKLKRLLFRKL